MAKQKRCIWIGHGMGIYTTECGTRANTAWGEPDGTCDCGAKIKIGRYRARSPVRKFADVVTSVRGGGYYTPKHDASKIGGKDDGTV